MLILSCYESNSPKVGQICSLNLNLCSVRHHRKIYEHATYKHATMPFIVQNANWSHAAARFRASHDYWRRMEGMRK